MSVVSNTSPLNYLALIGHSEILPALYGRVIIPRAVLDELQAPKAPTVVRLWLADSPGWLEVRTLVAPVDPALNFLGSGESEATELASEVGSKGLLIDDRDGRQQAERRGLRVIGTLATLADASDLGLLDLAEAVGKLQRTSFRAPPHLLKILLNRRNE